MKKATFAILACTLVFGSCRQEAVKEDYSITASPSLIEMAVNGNDPASVDVFSAREWYVINKADWISIEESEGGFTVTVSDNVVDGGEIAKERTAELVVSNSARSARVKVHQAGEALPIASTIPGAMWEITSTYAKNSEKSWVEDNAFYANAGTASGKAYVMSTGSAKRILEGSNIALSSVVEGDAIQFVWPGVEIKAGTDIDFMTCLFSTAASVPKYWIFEYEEDGLWKSVGKDLKSAPEDETLKYSFRMYSSNNQYTSFVQNFTLASDLKGDLKIRCRAVGSINAGGGTLEAGSGSIGIVNSRWRGACINVYGGLGISGRIRLLEIGNSFTYYYAGNYMLKEIARSQGLQIDMRTFCKGMQYLRNYSSLEIAMDAIKEGSYEYAIIQDQTAQQALYYSDPKGNGAVLEETRDFFSLVKKYSPSVNIILEQVQAFPDNDFGSYGSFDKLDWFQIHGAELLSQETGCRLSPIGIAFRKARQEGIEDLYYSDDHHPNRNGAYLKACVNCLVLTGRPFDGNVPDCLVEAGTAARLREIAEDVVLDCWRDKMFVVDQPVGTNFDAMGGDGSVNVYSDVAFEATCPESWLYLTRTEGRVSWTVALNELPQARNATLTIAAEGKEPKQIQISQSGLDISGGINSAEELVEFASLVNSGADYSKFYNSSGEVALNRDIDMSGIDWVPAGLPAESITLAYNTAPDPGANAFKGKFNGNGHKISNLALGVDIKTEQFCGLFAALNGATVKNLKIENASMVIKGEGIVSGHAVAGIVAAYSLKSSIENVSVSGSISGSAYSIQSKNVAVGGVCGFAGSGGKIESCTMDGSIKLSIESKYSNGNTVSIAGVLGACIDLGSSKISIKDCTNNADLDVEGHRAAGVVATLYRASVEKCTNNGTIHCNYAPGAISVRKTTVTGVRIGGVMGYCSHQTSLASISGCLNTGQVRTEEPESAAGGTIGLIRCMSVNNCSNSGNVICPDKCFGRGLLVGCLSTATTQSTFWQCKLKGGIGASEASLVAATKDNYLNAGIGISFYDTASSSTWNGEEIAFWE